MEWYAGRDDVGYRLLVRRDAAYEIDFCNIFSRADLINTAVAALGEFMRSLLPRRVVASTAALLAN